MGLYEVVCDRTINSDEDLKQGKLFVKIGFNFTEDLKSVFDRLEAEIMERRALNTMRFHK